MDAEGPSQHEDCLLHLPLLSWGNGGWLLASDRPLSAEGFRCFLFQKDDINQRLVSTDVMHLEAE